MGEEQAPVHRVCRGYTKSRKNMGPSLQSSLFREHTGGSSVVLHMEQSPLPEVGWGFSLPLLHPLAMYQGARLLSQTNDAVGRAEMEETPSTPKQVGSKSILHSSESQGVPQRTGQVSLFSLLSRHLRNATSSIFSLAARSLLSNYQST